MEKEFEDFWAAHRPTLIARAPQTLKSERENSAKMNTAGDWLLFALPIIAMIWFLNSALIANELLNFVAAAAIGIVLQVPTMLLKPYVTGKRSVADIDKDIRQHFYTIYKEKGIDGLR